MFKYVEIETEITDEYSDPPKYELYAKSIRICDEDGNVSIDASFKFNFESSYLRTIIDTVINYYLHFQWAGDNYKCRETKYLENIKNICEFSKTIGIDEKKFMKEFKKIYPKDYRKYQNYLTLK